MRSQSHTLLLCACAVSASAIALNVRAQPQRSVVPTSYARLQITGDDALLFTERRIVRFEGPRSRDDLPVENSKGLRAIVPSQIIHLNNAAAEGWEVVGPVDPDAMQFLLRRR